MNVTETTQTTSSTQQTTTTESSASALSSDFETFLKMLTTQMENQDPLNPMESTDFAVQLATFSSVEQQVQINDQLTNISGQLQLSGLGQAASWVGMEARAAGPAWFNGQPITLMPEISAGADKAVLVVSDAQGQIVQNLNIGTHESAYTWSGTYEDGTPLPDGTYSFSIQSYDGDDLLGAAQPDHFATVTEVRLTDTGTAVVLTGGVEVATDNVAALREPVAGS